MNSILLTGTVLGKPEKIGTRSCGRVCNFRIVIDTRSGKRPTEVTVSCWDDLARFFGQYLSDGDHIAVMGSLSHMVGEGIVVNASQLARLTDEASAERYPHEARQGPKDSEIETNWMEHLDLGAPGAQR